MIWGRAASVAESDWGGARWHQSIWLHRREPGEYGWIELVDVARKMKMKSGEGNGN